MNEQQPEQMNFLHALGPLLLTRLLLRPLVAAGQSAPGRSQVWLTSSDMHHLAMSNWLSCFFPRYSYSKMLTMNAFLQMEAALAPAGVAVNAYTPGHEPS
jgi:NAD(P)-dependent dehydrogenase (short-subunit alcohol dehydrogenase family)